MNAAAEGLRAAFSAHRGRALMFPGPKRRKPGRSRAFEQHRGMDAKPASSQRVQRARERTWKTSKLSSATCHQRYWSPRKAAIESIAFLNSGFFAEISL